ncbi:MAG: amidohydrolase family protein [Planctomycetaceae bacterium]|nr:amidohydrolase family protein [Planctomycetaceae bacterium]
MIVDCHTHLHCPKRGNLAEEHQAVCSRLDGCLVLAGISGERGLLNSELSEYTAQNRKARGFAVINPIEDDISHKAVKKATVEQGLCGVVLYCAEENFHPAHTRAMRLYEEAEGLGLVVFFNNCPPYSAAAILDYAQPWLIDEIARTFPQLKIIVGRMGLPFYLQTEALLSKHENVYADLSLHPQRVWQIYNLVLSAYEAGIMDKLLFGSGYPYAEPDDCIETLLGFNRMLANTHLPQVPREKLRSVVERDSLTLLGIK